MSDYAAVAESLDVPKSKLGTCINSRASQHYCKAIGMGDLHLELPNGSGKTKVVFKDTIHAPAMAFTCYISFHSITTTPPTSLTPTTLTPTYTSFTLTMFSYLQIHPIISSPALTTLLSLIPILLNYCSLPYLFLVL